MEGRIEIRISDHCVDRYIERVKPALSIEQAEADLERLVGLAGIAAEPPAWHEERSLLESDGYVVICDEIALPLQRAHDAGVFVATTCVTRTSVSGKARAKRNHHKRSRRAAKRARAAHAKGASNRRPVPAFDPSVA